MKENDMVRKTVYCILKFAFLDTHYKGLNLIFLNVSSKFQSTKTQKYHYSKGIQV